MNITHVVENLNRGGLERMVLDLVDRQQASGHRCQVVCLFDTGALAPELEALGIPIVACGKRRGLDLRALGRLRSLVRTHDTDVLHTHNAVAHYHAVLASAGLKVHRIINTRHGMGANRRSGRREWLYKRALSRTDVIVTVCEAARAAALERGLLPERRARVVRNGIRVQAFRPANESMRGQLHRMLNASAGMPIVGHVGRLNWTKDQQGLIKAFSQARKSVPDAALVLVGDGELRVELQQCARSEGVEDAVHFLGDRDDVHELLQGFDLFVLSSVSEGYSMALLEAAATALPIVATDVGGNAEIVRNGVTGRLVQAHDIEALATAMVDLLQQPEAAKVLGRQAREWVESDGSIDLMASRYEALYEARELHS